MGIEIERKFLVLNNDWEKYGSPILYKQGYLSTHADRTVRVRITGDNAFLTIKGRNEGIKRLEYEYEIPINEANELLNFLCDHPIIEKTRTKIEWEGFIWEVDEFMGINKGLVIAEIELPSENTHFKKPNWIGKEVSEDIRYYNSNLTKLPFSKW
jgi:adenylate cyclase